VLEVNDIRVHIGPLYILQGVSIKLRKGETFFIIGRNGAGKSTLLKTLIGFIKPSSGSIVFEGKGITYEPPYVRAKLGIRYVPDNKRLFTSLSVEENLLAPLLAEGLSKDKAMDRIEYVYNIFPDLKKLRKLKASQLSGGQQQMLNLARAIVSPNLKLLLADEPVEGLSPVFVSKILNAFSELANEGVTMIIVETMPVIMKELSGRCAILNAGRVVFESSTEELLRNEIVMKTYFGLA